MLVPKNHIFFISFMCFLIHKVFLYHLRVVLIHENDPDCLWKNPNHNAQAYRKLSLAKLEVLCKKAKLLCCNKTRAACSLN